MTYYVRSCTYRATLLSNPNRDYGRSGNAEKSSEFCEQCILEPIFPLYSIAHRSVCMTTSVIARLICADVDESAAISYEEIF